MLAMRALLREALGRPVDYSETFTRRVQDLARLLGEVLGVMPHHTADMNYRAGQLLTVWLGPEGQPVTEEQGNVVMRIALSSRGPLFAVIPASKDGSVIDLNVDDET